MGICTKIAAGRRRCAAAAIALCLVATLSVAAAAPASADVLLLEPTSWAVCTSTTSCARFSGQSMGYDSWEGLEGSTGVWGQIIDINDAYVAPVSQFSGGNHLAWVYDYSDLFSNTGYTYSIAQDFYIFAKSSAAGSQWVQYRASYVDILIAGNRLYVIYDIPQFTAYWIAVPSSFAPSLLLDTGDTRITAPELEDKVEATTEAVEENTAAVEDLKDSLLDTSGSDSLITGVLGDDEEGWLCSRLGFLCTVANIPVTMLETVFVTPASDSWDFPGITLPGFDLEIEAQEVSLWTFVPSETQTLIKGGATFIIILLWIKGMFSLYRRFIGEEQTVQVEGSD